MYKVASDGIAIATDEIRLGCLDLDPRVGDGGLFVLGGWGGWYWGGLCWRAGLGDGLWVDDGVRGDGGGPLVEVMAGRRGMMG